MNSTLKNIFMFALGASVGSVVTWKLLKTKYEQIANEEIASVKEVFTKKYGTAKQKKLEKPEKPKKEVTVQEYAAELAKNGYVRYSDTETEEGGGKNMKKHRGPYVITPDEYGENHDYEIVTLYYCADKVLVNEYDEVIEDVEGTVGEESLTHFGEYEADSVFVRNDAMKIDYEILLDARNFRELNIPG